MVYLNIFVGLLFIFIVWNILDTFKTEKNPRENELLQDEMKCRRFWMQSTWIVVSY